MNTYHLNINNIGMDQYFVNPSSYYIILKENKFNSNLSMIFNSDQYDLVLITTEDNFSEISEEQRRYLKRIITVKELNSITLQKILGIEKDNGMDVSISRICTPEEGMLMLVAKIRELFNIPGDSVDGIEKFSNKLLMKHYMLKGGIKIPHYTAFDNIEFQKDEQKYYTEIINKFQFPIFAKPIDGTSSEGTSKLHTPKELKAWFEKHRHYSNYELDEFIEGTLYHCDSIVINGQPFINFLSEYNCPMFNYFSREQSNGSIIVLQDSQTYLEISEFNKKILSALAPLPNSAFHLEIFKRKNGELIFLEIAARPGGLLITNMYNKHYNINMEENHFKAQLGLNIVNKKNALGPYAAWLCIPKRTGVVKLINNFKISSDYIIDSPINIGDKLEKSKQFEDYAALIFMWNNNYENLSKDFKNLSHFKYFEIENS